MRWIDLPVLAWACTMSMSFPVAIRATTERQVETLVVPVHRISDAGIAQRTGEIRVRQFDAALELIVSLNDFSPGWHAMHVHENPSCAPALVDGEMVAGAAAGRHYDPTGVIDMKMDADESMPRTMDSPVLSGPRDGKAQAIEATDAPDLPGNTARRRARPLGVLPAVYVAEDGETEYRILTYRLRLDQLSGRSIMLHEHGEAPTDPALPRGGGDRIACAVVP